MATSRRQNWARERARQRLGRSSGGDFESLVATFIASSEGPDTYSSNGSYGSSTDALLDSSGSGSDYGSSSSGGDGGGGFGGGE